MDAIESFNRIMAGAAAVKARAMAETGEPYRFDAGDFEAAQPSGLAAHEDLKPRTIPDAELEVHVQRILHISRSWPVPLTRQAAICFVQSGNANPLLYTDEVDATAEFATALNDPTKWRVNKGVAYFKPHRVTFNEVRNEAGQVIRQARTVEVTETDLEEICRSTAAMEAAGQFGVITAGHRTHGKPESEQPIVFGFLRNPRVVRNGAESRLLFDEYVYPDKFKERGQYPYRSVDFYPGPKQIFGAAILKNRPKLNLGTFAYTCNSRGECIQFSLDAVADDWDSLVARFHAETEAHRETEEQVQQSDPHRASEFHEAAMELIRSRPGTTYDRALSIVRFGS